MRANRTPVFISERTPGENREDLWELLEACGMDHLNRLEWLIRTDSVYSGDRFFVDRYEEVPQPITIQNMEELGNRSVNINRKLLDVICSGGKLVSPDFIINDSTRGIYYPVLLEMFRTEKRYLKMQQDNGVRESKDKGKYKGRKRKDTGGLKAVEIIRDYYGGKLTADQAAERMDVSRSTFFRRAGEYRSEKL